MTTISRVHAWQVEVPCRPGAVNSPAYGTFIGGHEWDRMPICLLEVEMSDGGVGLGEVDRGVSLADLQPWLRELPGVAVGGLAPALPERWRALSLYGGAIEEAHPPAIWASPSPALPALEMAVLDWAGRRLGWRVADLLGGAYREAVPVDYWCGRKTPADLRETAAAAVAGGFSGLKMKSRLGDPVVEQVAALREVAGPGFSVTIDPMYQWYSPLESLATLKALEQFGSGVRVEDPFPEDRPEMWRRAREAAAVPLVWHARGQASLRRALQERCADAFNVCGSAREFLTAAHAVELAGYSCWRGSSLELGVGQVFGLQCAAAARNCVLPSDFQSGVLREHTLIRWDWPYRNGSLALPAGAGLGVELERDALRHYTRAEAVFP